jgi:hypothetical protein
LPLVFDEPPCPSVELRLRFIWGFGEPSSPPESESPSSSITPLSSLTEAGRLAWVMMLVIVGTADVLMLL